MKLRIRSVEGLRDPVKPSPVKLDERSSWTSGWTNGPVSLRSRDERSVVGDRGLMMEDLYREQIIDRYKHPLMRGTLDPHDYSYEDDNPLCGDRIRIDLRVGDDDRITEAAFSGVGCAIAQASADLLVESVVGKTLDEIKALRKEDILEMLGIELGPVRLKCALLSLKVLKAGVYGIEELEEELT